jgi:lia operon protein LiaG
MEKLKRILILLLVITGLYIVFNQSVHFNVFGDNSNKDGHAAISNGISMINIDISSGSTTIIPEDRKDLKAVYTGKRKLTVKEDGDTVEVTLKSKGFNWFDWGSFSDKSKLKIYIPKNYDRSMFIDLGSGNLDFSGESKNKPVKLDELTINIGSGNMNLKNLNVKQFGHDGGSGNVDIDSLKTKTGTFDIASGNLDIKHYTGAIRADVSSGRLNIQLDKLIDSIQMDVTSGNVGLDLPDNANFTLNGDVSSGNISCDFPLTTKDLNKKSIKGTHGSGKYKIGLDVTSGNIRIY